MNLRTKIVIAMLAAISFVSAPFVQTRSASAQTPTQAAVEQLATDNATVANPTSAAKINVYIKSMRAYAAYGTPVWLANVCQQSTLLASALRVLLQTGGLTQAEFGMLWADNNAIRTTLPNCAPIAA